MRITGTTFQTCFFLLSSSRLSVAYSSAARPALLKPAGSFAVIHFLPVIYRLFSCVLTVRGKSYPAGSSGICMVMLTVWPEPVRIIIAVTFRVKLGSADCGNDFSDTLQYFSGICIDTDRFLPDFIRSICLAIIYAHIHRIFPLMDHAPETILYYGRRVVPHRKLQK